MFAFVKSATDRRVTPGGRGLPLLGNPPLLEPSWCQSGSAGFAVGWEAPLWTAAMETGCWDAGLGYSSCADVASPDSTSNARTPARQRRET